MQFEKKKLQNRELITNAQFAKEKKVLHVGKIAEVFIDIKNINSFSIHSTLQWGKKYLNENFVFYEPLYLLNFLTNLGYQYKCFKIKSVYEGSGNF